MAASDVTLRVCACSNHTVRTPRSFSGFISNRMPLFSAGPHVFRLKGNNTMADKATLSKMVCLSCQLAPFQKGKDYSCPKSEFFPFREDPCSAGDWCSDCEQELATDGSILKWRPNLQKYTKNRRGGGRAGRSGKRYFCDL